MKINLDNIDLQDIYEFMETGNPENAPEEVVYYLQLLDRIHGMHLRILQFGNSRAIIKHLMITEEISQYYAQKLYDEMREYFYRDSGVSKQVYRNIYAQRMEDLAVAATIISKSPEDKDRVTRMYERIGKMRQLDLVDPPELPPVIFEKPINVFAMDIEFLGEEKINRLELARQIDELEGYTTSERTKLKQDAALEPQKLFKDESEADN